MSKRKNSPRGRRKQVLFEKTMNDDEEEEGCDQSAKRTSANVKQAKSSSIMNAAVPSSVAQSGRRTMARSSSVDQSSSSVVPRRNSSSRDLGVSSCSLCGRVFKYKRCLSRHLFVEHEVRDDSENVRHCKRLAAAAEVEDGNKTSEGEENNDDDDEEDSSIRRTRQGFLPDKEAIHSQNAKKTAVQSKRLRMDKSELVRSISTGMLETSSEAKGGSHVGKKSSAKTSSDLGRYFVSGEGSNFLKCHVCHCIFDSVKNLQEHHGAVHSASAVAFPDVEASSKLVNGRCDPGDELPHIAVNGPSESIVSEPDFEVITGTMKGSSLASSNVQNNVRSKWSELPNRDDAGCKVDDDSDEVEGFCVASMKNSGTKETEVVKYKVNLRSEEVLVTRVLGFNVNSGEKSYLYKCHLCARVFLALDKLQEHLVLHLPKSQKTFMCYNCGQLFSHISHFKTHLTEYHKADYNVDYLADGTVASNHNADGSVVEPEGSVKSELSEEHVEVPESTGPPSDGEQSAVDFKSSKAENDQMKGLEKDMTPSPSPNPVQNEFGSRVGYQCSYCPKVFDRVFSLNRHLRSHTGVKPCYCQVCGKGFSESRNLKHHIIRFHSDGSERHLLRRYRNYRDVKHHKSVSVARGKDSGGSNHQRLTSSSRFRRVSNVSCSVDGAEAELDIPQEDSGRTSVESEGNLRTWSCDGRVALSRSAVEECRRRGHRRAKGDERDVENHCGKSSDSDDLVYHKSALDNMIDEELQILADPKLSLMSSVRKPSRQRQRNGSCRGTDSSSYSNKDREQNSTSLLPVEASADMDSADSVDRTCRLSGDLDSLKLMSSVASLISPLSPLSNAATMAAADSSTDYRRTKGKNSYFSHYFPRLDVVSNPVMRSEVCKPVVLSDGKIVYSCCYCNKYFGSTSDVNRHMDFHEDVRPYKCKLCNYYSRTNSQLKVHMMRHQGIKQYFCEVCTYYAVTQSDLNRHKKTKAHRIRARNMCQVCGIGHLTGQQKVSHALSCHFGFSLASDRNGSPSEINRLTDTAHGNNDEDDDDDCDLEKIVGSGVIRRESFECSSSGAVHDLVDDEEMKGSFSLHFEETYESDQSSDIVDKELYQEGNVPVEKENFSVSSALDNATTTVAGCCGE